MPKKKNSTIKFKLLTDKPLSNDSEKKIRFGHKEVANTLVRLIKGATPPFTLGLYGTWGSGKSTIMNLVRKGLFGTSFTVVEFDVWKYEGDGLRRQFLLETTKQLLGKKGEEKLRKQLDYDVEFIEEGPMKVNVKLALLTFCTVLAMFLIPVVYIFIIIGDLSKWRETATLIIAGLAGAGWASQVLPGYLNSVFKTLATKIVVVQEVTLKRDKLSKPEEFQEKFEEIIKNDKNKNKKIVFILDNLDRSSHDKAVELLTTVKTFLEVEKCIFLIPCDEEAVKKHISATYFSSAKDKNNGGTAYAEEYLRKFFNAIVRIPRFEGLDLDSYTQDLLKEAEVPEFQNNSVLTWVITSSFRNNPREIKQFINTLISSTVLIKEKVLNGDIVDEKVLENNIAFLAKILIFKQKYPRAFNDLQTAVIEDGKNWEDLDKQTIEANGDEPEAIKFFITTDYIIPNQVDVSFFFTFNQSTEEHSLPQWSQFKAAALNREFDLANQIFQGFLKDKNLQSFENVGSNFISSNKSRLASIKPFISTYLNVYSREENKERLFNNGDIAIEVGQILQSLITNSYSEFPVQETVSVLKDRIQTQLLKPILSAYVDLLTQYDAEKSNLDDKNISEILTYIANDSENLFAHEVSNIKKALKEKFSQSSYIKLFAKSPYRENVIDTETLNKLLTSLVAVDLNSQPINSEDLEVMTSFELGQTEFDMVMNHSKNLMSFITTNPEKRKEVFEFIKSIIRKQPKSQEYFQQDSIRTHANDISSNLVTLNNEMTEPSDKVSTFPLALALHSIPNNAQGSALSGIMEPLVKGISYDELYSKLDETEIEELVSKFPIQYLEASLRDDPIYQIGKRFLNEEQKESFANSLVGHSITRSLQVVKDELASKLTDPLAYIKTVLEKIGSTTDDQKIQFLELAYGWKFGDNEEVAKQLYQVIFPLKQNLLPKTRKMYAEELKKHISKEELKVLTRISSS